MKSKPLYVPAVMAVMSALVNVVSASAWTTTAPSFRANLNGKMFTLSSNGGGISFYPAYFNPSSTTIPRYTTRSIPTARLSTTQFTTTARLSTTRFTPTTTSTTKSTHTTTSTTRFTPTTTSTTRFTPTTTSTTKSAHTTTRFTPTTTSTTKSTPTYPPWTSAPPVRGVSVCLRFLTDYQQSSSPTIFTLSPSSRNPLKMAVSVSGVYVLSFDRYEYNRLYLQPNKLFWTHIEPEIWTTVCLTVDSMKNVAQVFSGPRISIRKMLPSEYAWSGEPVIYFPGFDGQVTDVQVWDYPISYREIYNYMTTSVYRPDVGSVLTWSSISYSPRGRTLLEDIYERQAKRLVGRRGRWHRPKGGKKKTRLFSSMGERKDRKEQQL
uniref:uncharacterized serine-rich protein C215.13-like n=1 Tax=Scatophagus argus TaxID=75038 RepID=UPI001ED822D3|nr:uncharacterized serine-rich protein C215.13-like [Scatophagus argus]